MYWVSTLCQKMCQVWSLYGQIYSLCCRDYYPHFYELKKFNHKSLRKLPSLIHLSST